MCVHCYKVFFRSLVLVMEPEPSTQTNGRDFVGKTSDRAADRESVTKAPPTFNAREDLPDNYFVAIQGQRRSGKSTVCEAMLIELFKGSKKDRRLDTVILFSPTMAGFKGVPNSHKYDTLEHLPLVLQRMQDLKQYNEDLHKKKQKGATRTDYITERLCIVLDDCLAITGKKTKTNPRGGGFADSLLTACATNGRHIVSNDRGGSTLSFFLLSQTVTGIPAVIRRNCDVLMASRAPSRRCRQSLCEEQLVIDSSRYGLTQAYNMFDCCTLQGEYAFVAVLNYHSNKNDYDTFVRWYIAPKPDSKKVKKLFGSAGDWAVKLPKFDITKLNED